MNLGYVTHRKLKHRLHNGAEGTYVMGEVRVHDNHKISGAKLQTVDVGGPATVGRHDCDVQKPEYTYPSPSLPARGFSSYNCNSVCVSDGQTSMHIQSYHPRILEQAV
jgi:hypothetical protein